jgi:environmental stress-induced protein Ves
MPWKNGLGVTTELARSPRDGELDWRVSVARVTAGGPFSSYPGCDRIIVALESDGMILTHTDQAAAVTLGALEPYRFRGEWETVCTLRGKAFRDFNVITRRAAFQAAVSVSTITQPGESRPLAPITMFYCVSGNCVLGIAQQSEELLPDHALLIEGGTTSLRVMPSVTPAVVIAVGLTPV